MPSTASLNPQERLLQLLAQQKKLRVLVLSGGGVKGSLQLGVLDTLLKKNPDLDYDIIVGTSVGALNAAVLASCGRGVGHFVDTHKMLTELWMGIQGNRDVYRFRWRFSKCFRKKGLYHTRPLLQKIEAYTNPQLIKDSGRHVAVGIWNVKKDKYFEVDVHHPKFQQMVLASASYPVVFEPVEVDGEILADGGVKNNLPVDFLHTFAGHIGHVDIISTFPCSFEERQGSSVSNILEYLIQTLNGVMPETYTNDFYPFYEYKERYPGTTFDVYAPEKVIDVDPLDFKPQWIRQFYEVGQTLTRQDLANCLPLEPVSIVVS